jgi:type II secretory pathway pseudopilin PulG
MKNQKGISLIALIITIIVIIILAAIVISSAVNTPEQANWAKFCGNYAEIQSAISTKTAEVYGNVVLDPLVTVKPSIDQVRVYVVSQAHTAGAAWPTGATGQTYPAALTGVQTQQILATNQLGITGFTVDTNWVIDLNGVLRYTAGVANPNASGALYITPTTPHA